MKKRLEKAQPKVLLKTPAGIEGLDEITGGGLPKGRPTQVYRLALIIVND
jgi:circadian clock protein KaiC